MIKELKRKFSRIALVMMALQLAFIGVGGGATGAQAAVDVTAAVTAHDEAAKTITYTFSEPVQLKNENTDEVTPVAPGNLDIYTVTGTDYNLSTKTLGTTVTGATFNGAGLVLTVTYTGSLIKNVDTDYIVDAWGYDVIDVAGNAITPSADNFFTVAGDITPPTAILIAETPTNKNVISVSLNFSEPVTGLTLTGLTIGGGTAQNLTGSLDKYNFEIVPTDLNSVQNLTVDLAAGAVQDLVGNDNLAATQLLINFDPLAPAAITGLAATTDAAGHVSLTWVNPNITGTFTTLRIVRNGTMSVMLDPTATSFLDLTTVPGGTYQYVVIVGDAAGNETATSQVTVSVPAAVIAAAVSDSTGFISETTTPSDDGTEVKADTTSDTATPKTDSKDEGFPVWGIILLLILAAVGGYLIWNQAPVTPNTTPVAESKKKNSNTKTKKK